MADGLKATTLSEQRLLIAGTILFCCLLWYVVYELIMVTAAEQFKRLLVVSPLLIVVLVHWLSAVPPSSRFKLPVPGSEPADFHRAGGSPWGVGLLLLLLFFLISYQPNFNFLSS